MPAPGSAPGSAPDSAPGSAPGCDPGISSSTLASSADMQLAMQLPDARFQKSRNRCSFACDRAAPDDSGCSSRCSSTHVSARSAALVLQLAARKQAFAAWCRRVRMPEAAVTRWLQSSDVPRLYFRIYVIMSLCAVSTFSVGWFWGTAHMPLSRRMLTWVVIAVAASVYAGNIPVVIALGPDPVLCWPRSWAIQYLAFALSSSWLWLSAAAGSEVAMPFQSRPAFLLLCVLYAPPVLSANIAAVMPWERALRRSTPWPIVLATVVRTVKTLDTLSDVMFTKLLYDVVRSLNGTDQQSHAQDRPFSALYCHQGCTSRCGPSAGPRLHVAIHAQRCYSSVGIKRVRVCSCLCHS